jgi:cytochrome P450 RapN
MAAVTDEVVPYPGVVDQRLEVDPVFKEFQKDGLVRVQLPYGEPCWLATRYDHVRSVYGDRRFSRAAGFEHDVPRVWPGNALIDPSMPLAMDAPRHTRLRRLTAGTFSPRRVRELRSWVQGEVDELLDQMEQQGPPADFVAHFAWDLPIRVLTRIMGVPRDDSKRFRHWVETATGVLTPPGAREDAQGQLNAYVIGLITDRRAAPQNDLLSDLVHATDDEDRLNEAELLGLIMSLLAGGFETTAWQLGATAYALMDHPEHWRQLVDDPELLPNALEELWRWIPSFKYGTNFVRWASTDVELSPGALVRAGEAILPEQAVANRDESVFPHGWELDFHRSKPKPHLSLGFGEHYCMGANLAQMQIALSVEALVLRYPDLRLSVPSEEVKWSESSFMRSVELLPLDW